MKLRISSGGAFLLTLLQWGCTVGIDPDLTCSRQPPLSHTNFGEGFMNQYCTGCHSSLLPEGYREDAPLGVDFDSWGGVVENADEIWEKCLGDSPDMPPGGGPTETDFALLAEWLECEVLPEQALLLSQDPL